MKIEELIQELKEYDLEDKFEPVLLHSTKIQLMMDTIEKQKEEIQKLQGVALHWEGQASYWENLYNNKKWRL